MYGPPGTAYVYRAYGIHWCFNVVTEREEYPAAVLVRALEPMDGSAVMSRRRKQQDHRLLCSGPGRLTQALGITSAFNRVPLDDGLIVVKRGNPPPRRKVGSGVRIGVSQGADWELRFFERDSPWLSRRG